MTAKPPARPPWEQRDTLLLGGALVVAASPPRSRCSAACPRQAARRADRDPGARLLPVGNAARSIRTVVVGLALQILFALIVLKTALGSGLFQQLGAADHAAPGFAVVGSSFVFGPLGDKAAWAQIMTAVLGAEGARVRRHLRVHGAADDHLHRRAVRDPLLLRRHAAGRAGVRHRHAPRDASERRRIAERRRQHLHGSDRGAADHPAVPAADDRVGADDGDDRRHGAHLRRRDGRLHPVRRRAPSICSPPSS